MAALPREYGGIALTDGIDLCTILRCLGAADLSVARLIEGHINAVALVCRYSTEEQIGMLATSVTEGALSAVWGADDAHGLKIVSDENGRALRGRKILASGAGFVTRPLVTAAADDGQTLCLLELTPGYDCDISAWRVAPQRNAECCQGGMERSPRVRVRLGCHVIFFIYVMMV